MIDRRVPEGASQSVGYVQTHPLLPSPAATVTTTSDGPTLLEDIAAELEAMQLVAEALDLLSPESRERVLAWAKARFPQRTATPPLGSTPRLPFKPFDGSTVIGSPPAIGAIRYAGVQSTPTLDASTARQNNGG